MVFVNNGGLGGLGGKGGQGVLRVCVFLVPQQQQDEHHEFLAKN